jgi:hypothetical protein
MIIVSASTLRVQGDYGTAYRKWFRHGDSHARNAAIAEARAYMPGAVVVDSGGTELDAELAALRKEPMR